MRVRFWGTRGSIATPGASTLRYGGNTSCVEVECGGTCVVLDAGTGAHALGRALVAEGRAAHGHLLIGHTHWDHIQGLPFFDPLFQKDAEWHVYGPRGLSHSLRDALAGQMQYAYFPLALDQLMARVHYHDLVEGTFDLGDLRCSARYLNHPALTLGYRLEGEGVTLVYSTDHEPHARPEPGGGRSPHSREDEQHVRFLAGADLVIHDAQYSADEYPDRVGWGHSSVEYAVDVARAAGVRRLALFHHDPRRDDASLEALVERARRNAGPALDVFAAREGEEIVLAPRRRARPETVAPEARPSAEPVTGRVLLAGADAPALGALEQAARRDDLEVVRVRDAAGVRAELDRSLPSLVGLRRRLPDADGLDLAREISARPAGSAGTPPVVLIADAEHEVDLEAGAQAGVADWLVWPFKDTYARTRLRCWLLRTACRWVPAPLANDEAERLASLRAHRLLDTPPEERFDRITRIASALFDVPTALVSLVDADRQWFKSRQGLDATETPRDMAFCAHAILGDDVMVVPDALRDDRFADNPLVTGPPRVRFYAGVPLSGSQGRTLGTLCLLDSRVRELDEAQRRLLRDLGRLVEHELARPPREDAQPAPGAG